MSDNAPDEGDTMPLDTRLRLIELTGQLGEQEADRTWSRFSISLPVHAGLIAIVSFSLSKSLYGFVLVIAALGCLLSFAWYRVVVFSAFAEERWRKDMTALINSDERLVSALRSRSSIGPRNERPPTSATDNARLIVLGVGAFWCVLAIYSTFQLI